jgi:8-oxo-dGTP pyrophosphatase MutT (NUDIX family)
MIIMNLKKFLGIQSTQEKVEDYRKLKGQLANLETLGQELSDKFSIQKSVIDGVDGLPEEKKSEVFEKYRGFLKEHQKEVSSAVNERNKILKSLEAYRNDPDVGDICKGIDALEQAEEAYRGGKLSKQVYFDIVKSITGEPTKYADVVAFDKDGRVLVLHRVENFIPTGKVCIPGGHVDPGEDFETAALRELKEETNLDPIEGRGIVYLGEHKTEDAHIKYFQVWVDCLQPVTVDASEHCFAEFIDLGQIPLKPFIFDQGEIVLDMLMKPHQIEEAKPLMKALSEGRITPEAFVPGFTSILKKALDIEAVKPLEPESMDGDKRKVSVPVRDPMKCVETIMKGISGAEEITVGANGHLKFVKPLIIHDTRYREDPSTNRLTEVEIVFTGDDNDMMRILEEMKYSLMTGPMKVRTPQEEFMAANERGTDYVGDPIFVTF